MKKDLIKSNEQQEAITEYGLPKKLPSMDIVESLQKKPNPLSQRKQILSEKSTQISKYSLILEPAATSKEKSLKPYWNNACRELQLQLWLPHKILSPQSDSLSLNGSLNYTEDKLSFWKTQITPVNLQTTNVLLPSLPISSIPITKNENIIGTKKIRIYPKDESKWFDMLSLNRRAYNLAIEFFIKNAEYTEINQIATRRLIREQCKKEFIESGRTFMGMVTDEAINAAFITFYSILKKRKNKIKCDFKFKSRKTPKQSFIIQKLSKNGIMPHLLNCFITEEKPIEAIGKMATVTFYNGRWFLNCKKLIPITKNDIQVNSNRVVSIDQGIRKFATSYSPKEVNFYGENFVNDKIIPLFKQLEVLTSQRQLILNKLKENKQWINDRLVYFKNKIFKIRNRISDLVNDLHKKICFDLVINYDYIILPKYETSNMVLKGKRKLSKIFANAMNCLSSYKFKNMLKHHCLKYGKQLLDSTEEYTSKTRSWNGIIDNKLSGKKIIKDDNIIVDRDINGARGIFLLALTR